MYQALYRKWRPKTFDDVIGQEHVTETLKQQIVSGRLSHAYLFVGTRGTGKTTCAKILSKAINCENPQDGNPCNACKACLGIENGSILDVLELDAASNNGVDNVRSLREEAIFTPADVKKRVYIIDEVHMLSMAAFNALLKILEEPPEHLVFILATTEIHKVPATILSRCQRFTFKRILPGNIADQLRHIGHQEGIFLTDDAADLLARLSDGSLRDALSLLDQCASDETVDYDRVLSAIGLAGSADIIRIFSAVAENDTAGALSILDSLYMSGKVMASVLEELTDLARDILLTSLMPKGGTGLLSGGFDHAALQSFAKQFSDGQLLSIIDTLRESAQNLSKSTGGKLEVELCLMRLCDNRLNGDNASSPAQPTQLVEKTKNAPVAERQPAQPARIAETPPHLSESPAAAPATPAVRKTPEIVPAQKPEMQPAVAQQEPAGDFWKEILGAVKPKVDIAPYSFLSDPTHTSAFLDGTALTIKTKSAFAAQMINVPAVTASLKEAAAAILKKPVMVHITQEDDSTPSGSSKLDALSRFPNIKFE